MRFFRTLSGRFLILTIVFVMLAEILIFVPSVARFREDFLLLRLERAQIASLTLLAEDMLEPELEAELLKNAGVYNVILHRDDTRQLALASDVPWPVQHHYDLRDASPWVLIRDALIRLATPENKMVRVIGIPVREAGVEIEVTMETEELRQAMLIYGRNIFFLSLFISLISAGMLFWVVRSSIVRPIQRVVEAMQSYAAAPEDARRIIMPDSGIVELRAAEDALNSMQRELTHALKQKERLAQLGGAVAKVSHDLRNILTVAQLMVDRMETSKDPAVQKTAPKLVNSITRAVNLCEGTLAFGKAEEPAPKLNMILLDDLVRDVLDSERLAAESTAIQFNESVPSGMMVRADSEQLHRVLSNLVRNARQAMVATGAEGAISVQAQEDAADWSIIVADNGPGLPAKARENLFTPFQGGVRKGGTGLGLAIAQELIRGHGGSLKLLETGSTGTRFIIRLPKGDLDA